jgi:hypothetical protein
MVWVILPFLIARKMTLREPLLGGPRRRLGWWEDFEAFVSRGSVVDLAIGIVIGGAFGKIVTSFVARHLVVDHGT